MDINLNNVVSLVCNTVLSFLSQKHVLGTVYVLDDPLWNHSPHILNIMALSDNKEVIATHLSTASLQVYPTTTSMYHVLQLILYSMLKTMGNVLILPPVYKMGKLEFFFICISPSCSSVVSLLEIACLAFLCETKFFDRIATKSH